MSLETHSTKRNRVYRRKFDHDEALRRHADGEGATGLAREYGVSVTAVLRVIDPATRRRLNDQTRRYVMSGVCIDCGKEGVTIHHRRPEGTRCRECWAKSCGTSSRADTLLCHHCREWKPDDEFPHSKSETGVRRGRHSFCRPCNTLQRREYRNRMKVPCDGGCGKYVEGKGRQNSTTGKNGTRQLDPNRPHLCQTCSLREREGANMTSTTQFLILVETETDQWTVKSRQAVSSRAEAIQLAFPNGNVPGERVVIVSSSAFRPGHLVPVQTYALEIEEEAAKA